ncbi:glycosyltransferase family 4 protein [Pontiella agarivorans]|uniref:Glycosyltransferase family 4 protein n=1 Tax=Pontiella agarivorans TaxID=3038953 RepID=A0ABU5MTC4_9BACT|nr:glycosyltransferase family 4 protein [Pontiella agarivorans]MDZ8117331.1 glycosyltransferase family 4 protein [Pontiella agarivorans]
MKSVVVYTRVTADYRLSFYKELNEILKGKGVSLKVCSGESRAHESLRSCVEKLPFGMKLHNQYIGKLCWTIGLKSHAKNADVFISEQASSLIQTYFIFAFKKFFGVRHTAFWGHGENLNTENPQWFRSAWKRYWLTKVDWWFAYTMETKRLLVESGFPSHSITDVQNSIDTSELKDALSTESAESIAVRFEEIFGAPRLEGQRVGIFCARLVPLKWIPFLLRSIEIMHEKMPDFRMLIIGDGVDRDLVKSFCITNSWCKWLGAVHGVERVKYFAIADIFINPGMTGLAVVDAFSAGIPYATTNNNIHSPEISYLENGINGIMTDPSEEAFAEAVFSVLNTSKLKKMKKHAKESGKNYTVEHMAKRYAEGVVALLEKK